MGNGPEFFKTPMGHRFYEETMPSLVRELKRRNDNLEKKSLNVVEELCKRCGKPVSNQGLCRGEDQPHKPDVVREVDETEFKKLLEELAIAERDLDDDVITICESIASRANNEGLESQLRFLVKDMGIEGVRRWLEK